MDLLFALCVLLASVGVYITNSKQRSLVDVARWRGWLPPLRFRRYSDADFDQCLELYRLNEPGRFPEGNLDEYARMLAEQSAYVLVAEQEGRFVATGGVLRYGANNTAFCYGLVHPRFQGRGIGTALLFARLSLLQLNPRSQHAIWIACVSDSLGFYKRFGFRKHGTWRDSTGKRHPLAYMFASTVMIDEVRELLRTEHIVVPVEDCIHIPQMHPDASSL